MNAVAETIKDRCERCDGIPDAQRLLAELRAQVEEARRERDTMRAAANAADVRIAELRAELANVRSEAAGYANAIGLIESTLGMVGGGLLCKTTRAVDAVVKDLAEARLAAEQGVLVARDLEERLRAERAMGGELRADLLVQAGQLVAARASLVEAATFARGVVGKCDRLTCAPSQQLAERWERQARGTEASHG